MIPFILAAVGGYLIGDSMKSDATKMADGGSIKTVYKEDERYSYPDFYKSQGGFKFKTIEEAKKFIKGTNPFVRKQLKLGNAVLAFNGEEYYIAEKIKVNDEYADQECRNY